MTISVSGRNTSQANAKATVFSMGTIAYKNGCVSNPVIHQLMPDQDLQWVGPDLLRRFHNDERFLCLDPLFRFANGNELGMIQCRNSIFAGPSRPEFVQVDGMFRCIGAPVPSGQLPEQGYSEKDRAHSGTQPHRPAPSCRPQVRSFQQRSRTAHFAYSFSPNERLSPQPGERAEKKNARQLG